MMPAMIWTPPHLPPSTLVQAFSIYPTSFPLLYAISHPTLHVTALIGHSNDPASLDPPQPLIHPDLASGAQFLIKCATIPFLSSVSFFVSVLFLARRRGLVLPRPGLCNPAADLCDPGAAVFFDSFIIHYLSNFSTIFVFLEYFRFISFL